MKILFLLIFATIFVFPQPDHDSELIITLKNRGTYWNVNFTLTAASPRWDENLKLTEQYEIVSNNATSPDYIIYFDHISFVNPGLQAGNYKAIRKLILQK